MDDKPNNILFVIIESINCSYNMEMIEDMHIRFKFHTFYNCKYQWKT